MVRRILTRVVVIVASTLLLGFLAAVWTRLTGLVQW